MEDPRKSDVDQDKLLLTDVVRQADKSDESSLSLSITPPFPEDEIQETKEHPHSDDSISEHITSNSNSIENDRSLQEIEITSQPTNLLLFANPKAEFDENAQDKSQEIKPSSLNCSFVSDTSFISLNYLECSDNNNVRSILDEILNDDKFVSGAGSKEESLNIFANVDLDDKSLNMYKGSNDFSLNEKNLYATNFDLPLYSNSNDEDKRAKDLGEILAIKDTIIATLTSELDSFREISNTNTISNSMVSTTEYKQLQEECNSKFMEYNSAIIYKNDLIQQLSESLDQSVTDRKELHKQVEHFKSEIAQLQMQLKDTSKMFEKHVCDGLSKISNEDEVDNVSMEKLPPESSKEKSSDKSSIFIPVLNLDSDYTTIEETMSLSQISLLNELKIKINDFVMHKTSENRRYYEEEIDNLKGKIQAEKDELESEIHRLRDLLANIKCGSTEIMDLKQELEAQHAREMENLRRYFEKKCADLEKNFSEEIFSQQSRKMSNSSSSDDLNSEALFANQPGPGGDIGFDLCTNLSKKDIVKLREELNEILGKINTYNMDEIADNDLSLLKEEIGKCSVNVLFKSDLCSLKNDLQSKHKEELEIVRGDFAKKLEELNLKHEERLKSLEGRYLEDLECLNNQLKQVALPVATNSSAVQEVASSGEFEINEVVESYERRLQEQVTLAKIDIFNALQNQIERLVANEAEDEEWPSELLQLRDRFTDKYEHDILLLKQEHEEQIAKIKDEHLKILNGALERARRRSLRDNDSLSKGELELLKERDNLKKQTVSLRNLLGELLKYFTQCEDELNNTLVDELLKHGLEKSQLDDDLNFNDSSTSNSSKLDSFANTNKRVHLTPNFSDLINLIETSSLEESESKDISIDLKNELGMCLQKLKQDANQILALTTNIPKQPMVSNGSNSLEEKVTSLTRQLISETQVKEQLKEELKEALELVQSMEKEKDNLENQMDELILRENLLASDLIKAKDKLAELIENGHKEIVSEGYGEHGNADLQGLGDSMKILVDLQEEARTLLGQSRASADPNLLRLIEELCRVGEKIKEESKKERMDLQQQIEAADKKYKTTRQFLEEQANEREQERDEAQKKIDRLFEQLKERDKDRASHERISSEVEQLEAQIQEMTVVLSEQEEKKKIIETERNEAVEKIKVLRDIIRELELQTELKTKEAEEFLQTIEKLQCIIDQQHRSIDDFKQNGSNKDVSDAHELRKHINALESELQQLRVCSELAGSEGAFKQIKLQLFEFEVTLDKKTRVLEGLHQTTTSCSSPSEDMSIRDLMRPQTPNTMVLDECEVPLQQLARLKEKLIRHSRAEDAALKRIKDLEMQVFGLKSDLEEHQNEKDYTKKQIQEQLVLISDLQIRLDEQRIRAEHIEKQTNTSLEGKIYDLQSEIMSLQERNQNKDKSINNLNLVVKETQQRLRDLEAEMSQTKDDEIVVIMQRELEQLRLENNQIKEKINKEAQILPNLVENIISDKNVDIEKLQFKLQDTERLLEHYTSLNLDRKELLTLSELKKSGNSIMEALSLVDLSQPEQMRKLDSRNSSLGDLNHFKRSPNETVFLGGHELSSIEKIGPSNVHYTMQPLGKPNSTELYKSMEKRVHFEDMDHVEQLKMEVKSLKNELEDKEKYISELEERLQLLDELEEKVEKLQQSLEETEKALEIATEAFEKEQKKQVELQKNLHVELAEKKMQLSDKEERVHLLELDSTRKDQMYLELTRNKKDLEKEIVAVKQNCFNNVDAVIKEKNLEIDDLKEKLQIFEDQFKENEATLQEKLIESEDLKRKLSKETQERTQLKTECDHLAAQLSRFKEYEESLQEKMKETDDNKFKLEKQMQNNSVQIEMAREEFSTMKDKLGKKRKRVSELEALLQKQEIILQQLKEENKNQKTFIIDRELEIEILNEDAKRYQNDLANLQQQINKVDNSLPNQKLTDLETELKVKDSKLEDLTGKNDELKKEVLHLQDFINEKEKIITQLTEDGRQLHVNLVTIQGKMKESGNIVDLANKLREEQKKIVLLLDEIHDLKTQLLQLKTKKSFDMAESFEEITGQVRRELDYSVQLDSNIISAVSDQSLSSISETQDAEIYKKALNKERARNRKVLNEKSAVQKQLGELKLQEESLKGKIKQMELELEQGKLSLHQTQMEDAKLIEQIRIQLDAALDNEEQFGKLLETEKLARRNLEVQLEALKQKSASLSSGSKTDTSTKYKALPSGDMFDIKAKLGMEQEYNKLVKEVNELKQEKKKLQSDAKYGKGILEWEVNERKSLEKKLMDTVEDVGKIKKRLLEVELELQQKKGEVESNKIAMDEMSDEKDLLNKHISDLIIKVRDQKDATEKYVNQLLNEKRQLEQLAPNNKTVDTKSYSAVIARSDYLFAKTLKLESVKKALIWQKRYLMDFLQSHQKHCLIETLPDKKRERRIRKNAPQRFRSAVFVVITIIRMKFLVKRWHSGRRFAEVNSRHHRQVNLEVPVAAHFQIGQPVSTQHFAANLNPFQKTGGETNDCQIGGNNFNPFLKANLGNNSSNPFLQVDGRVAPWSGATPPSKETRARNRLQIGSNILRQADLDPLQAPKLLAQFAERVDQIQLKLGVGLLDNCSSSSN